MKKGKTEKAMWTQFMDMHSGGGLKEPYQYIYIEAPEDEAKTIFYNRFGHNPERVTCSCCGEDYYIDSHEDLAQLTGFERGCRSLVTPRDPETGRYLNDDPEIKRKYYLEAGEDPPKGYSADDGFSRHRRYQALDDYLQNEDVLVIRADEIEPEERDGEVPKQGFVWVD